VYNALAALGIGLAVFAPISLWLGPIAAVVPAILAMGVAMFLLARRTGRLVEAEIARVVPLLQERKIDEAKQLLTQIKQRHGRWQFMLDGQMDAQIGMIDYLQMKFDDALPKLEKGRSRNWTALTCIGCIHWRQGRKEEAYKAFTEATAAGPKESMAYIVQASLLVRDGKRTEALAALDAGIQQLPSSELLKNLRNTVANKNPIKVQSLPQTWYQFFPEDMAQQMLVKGRRGPPPPGTPQQPQPRFGARHAPRR
jgi:tetratricopeptide (TPR) repeat protein